MSGQTYHMNARVYDPDIHRFLSPDPKVTHSHNPQGFNRYAYVMNNPLNMYDPDGFDARANDGVNDYNGPAAKSDATGKAEGADPSATGSRTGANDPTSGRNNHMNARVYDPDIGRFLSPDPTIPYAHNPQSFNRYAYAMNNPLNRVDLDGFSDTSAQSPEENNSETKSGDSVSTDNTDAKGTSQGANNPKGGKDSPTNGLKGQDIPGTVAPTEQPAQSRGALGSFISGLMGLGAKALAAFPGAGAVKAGVTVGKGLAAAEKGLKAEQALAATAKAAEEAKAAAALATKATAKGVTNTSIAKGAFPAVGNLTNKEVGQLVGWGTGPKDAAAAAASVTAKEVAAMQKSGLSKADAMAIQDFYTNEFARNANNLTAAHRADLMGKVADMMK